MLKNPFIATPFLFLVILSSFPEQVEAVKWKTKNGALVFYHSGGTYWSVPGIQGTFELEFDEKTNIGTLSGNLRGKDEFGNDVSIKIDYIAENATLERSGNRDTILKYQMGFTEKRKFTSEITFQVGKYKKTWKDKFMTFEGVVNDYTQKNPRHRKYMTLHLTSSIQLIQIQIDSRRKRE